jgi:hypothetical protein
VVFGSENWKNVLNVAKSIVNFIQSVKKYIVLWFVYVFCESDLQYFDIDVKKRKKNSRNFSL